MVSAISEAYVMLQLAIIVTAVIIAVWRGVHEATTEVYNQGRRFGAELDKILWRKK